MGIGKLLMYFGNSKRKKSKAGGLPSGRVGLNSLIEFDPTTFNINAQHKLGNSRQNRWHLFKKNESID